MKRRDAIKTLSLGFGYTIAIGGIAGIASCSIDSKDIDFISTNALEAQHKKLLDQISNIILPPTDTPGASEAGVADFIEMIVHNIYEKKDRDNYVLGLTSFDKLMNKELEISAFEANDDQITQMLTNHGASMSEERQAKVKELVNGDVPKSTEQIDEYYMYKFIRATRDLTITGYFSSELIGENHLSYDPIPGVYQGCIPVEDVGNAWSL